MRSSITLLTAFILAVTGCVSLDKAGVKPHATGTKIVSDSANSVISDQGGSIISDHGGSIISDAGGELIGKVKIPSGIISNNSGALVSNNSGSIIANNGGGLVSKTRRQLLALDEKPAAGFPITIVDAAGNPILDGAKKPYTTTTDDQGNYHFKKTPIGANLLVRAELPESVGQMVAFLPDTKEGRTRTAEVNGTSTLVMGYILDQYVKGDAKILAKLPGDVEADTRAKAATAIGDTLDIKTFKPDNLVSAVDSLRAKDNAFDTQVKVVEKLLLAGLTNLGDGESALKVALASPRGLARLSDGSLLVSERNGQRVRRIDLKTGQISTYAGKNSSTARGDGGPAANALINQPEGITVDENDNLYIAAFGDRVIRRVDSKTLFITCVAGNYTQPDGGATPAAGVLASSVPINYVRQVAIDENNKMLFLSGQGLFRVDDAGKLQPIDAGAHGYPTFIARGADKKVYTFRGETGEILRVDGNAMTPTGWPTKVGQANGNLMFGPDGTAYLTEITTLWKLPPGGTTWQTVPFNTPHGELSVGVVDKDNFYLSDYGYSRIWKLPITGGEATPIAGLDAAHSDAIAGSELSLNVPTSLALDAGGNLLVADGLNSVVWQRQPDGKFYRFAGGMAALSTDTEIGDGGPARDAKILKVLGLVRLKNGSVLLTESNATQNDTNKLVARIREVMFDGTIETRPMPVDKNGEQVFYMPTLLAEMPDSSILVSDYILKKLFRWHGDTAEEVVLDPPLKQPGFPLPLNDGSFYITDAAGAAVYLCKDGHATLVAGGNGVGFAGDGGVATAAKLNNPTALALGPNGDLYISDSKNDRVRRVRAGKIETVAGQGGLVLNGTTTDESIKEPLGLVFDAQGNLYIADSKHQQIKRVDAATLQ